MSIQVQFSKFEGPLALLLYLIRKEELDIYDIPIHKITQQYLEHIQVMKELNLEVAGEFVAMAATLIFIKSRMLVPQYNEQGEQIIDDPRKELVQKLLEYQKFQEISKNLYRRPILGRDVWLRGNRESLPEVDEGIVVDDQGLFALISAFRDLMKQATKSPHQVQTRELSISAKLLEIKDRFKVNEKIELRDLLGETFTKVDVIVTFLAILELSRLGFTKVYQTEPYAPLYITTLKAVTAEIVNNVQEFDATDMGGASVFADQLMAEAEENVETLNEMAESHVDMELLHEDQEIQMVESGELT